VRNIAHLTRRIRQSAILCKPFLLIKFPSAVAFYPAIPLTLKNTEKLQSRRDGTEQVEKLLARLDMAVWHFGAALFYLFIGTLPPGINQEKIFGKK